MISIVCWCALWLFGIALDRGYPHLLYVKNNSNKFPHLRQFLSPAVDWGQKTVETAAGTRISERELDENKTSNNNAN